jgi:very-short-patch-repair endonuclease
VRRVIHAASSDKVHFAREQRQKPTAAEQALWAAIRGGALGVRFRRQHPMGDFVLDFYCDEARLAVEVDGPDHAARAGYDAWRDEQLARQGVRVMRVTPEDVLLRLPGLLRRITESLTPYPPASRAEEEQGQG